MAEMMASMTQEQRADLTGKFSAIDCWTYPEHAASELSRFAARRDAGEDGEHDAGAARNWQEFSQKSLAAGPVLSMLLSQRAARGDGGEDGEHDAGAARGLRQAADGRARARAAAGAIMCRVMCGTLHWPAAFGRDALWHAAVGNASRGLGSDGRAVTDCQEREEGGALGGSEMQHVHVRRVPLH